MNWKAKAIIVGVIDLLPDNLSYNLYYFLQKRFGELRRFNPIRGLLSGISMAKRINDCGYKIDDKVFLEIGTGRVPIVPLALWLCGAQKVYTLDLNPYLKVELLQKSIIFIKNNKDTVKEKFGALLDLKRFNELIAIEEDFSLKTFYELTSIEYLPQVDARNLEFLHNTIDIYISNTVLEHIQGKIIYEILLESKNVIRGNGFHLHYIDYHDHFATNDKNISDINFLQYSELCWNMIAGNKYMYHNRLRHDDYLDIFSELSFDIQVLETKKNENILPLLSTDFSLNSNFDNKTEEILSIIGSWIVLK